MDEHMRWMNEIEYVLSVLLSVDEHHERHDGGVMLPTMTLLLPPLFVNSLLLGDLPQRPQILTTIPVEEDRLEDVLIKRGFGYPLIISSGPDRFP